MLEGVERIIIVETKGQAFALSERMYDEDNDSKSCPQPKSERQTQYLLGVVENLLGGQFGLAAPADYWGALDSKYRQMPFRIRSPLWVDENFVSGDPFMFIGSSPFGSGFGIASPAENREALTSRFAAATIREVRESGRKYTIEVHDRAKEMIELINHDRFIARAAIASMNPYAFEEMIAELLASHGFDTFLTRRSGDGGRDIIAAYKDGRETKLMMVECKNRKPGTVLGPVEARALVGQFDIERRKGSGFSRAMLVTSADRIGPTAMDIQETVPELSIKDYEAICDWSLQYGSFRDGLWLPKQFDQIL